MTKPHPILIASDLSENSDLAMTRALQLGLASGTPLIALNVIQEEPLWWVVKSGDLDPDELRRDLLREAMANLKDQARQGAKALGEAPPEIDAHARLGRTAEVVAEMADSRDCSLIVIGAHGRHAVRDWFLGTTAEKIVRESTIPVLVAKSEPTHAYQKVVVAIDFSAPSEAALETALAWAPRAQFTLVHAYETWFETYIDANTYERIRREQEEALADRLREFAAAAGVTSDHEPEYRVIAGHPGTTVVDAANDAHADLTVCGTQGSTGVRHLMLGSVAQHILRESKRDVMTVLRRETGI
ncbi:universal stress protein [Guyparkeria sp.]|uniref:universal stress protein n=1 Tax=Guyparkeria sp. TaxID=2035736 RepID=UPI003970B7FE